MCSVRLTPQPRVDFWDGQALARAGAQVFAFLSNAVDDLSLLPVWRSHLVSRAAENQRYVLAANPAHPAQKCPTLIVHPSGQILAEAEPEPAQVLTRTIDLADISDWYLHQARPSVPVRP